MDDDRYRTGILVAYHSLAALARKCRRLHNNGQLLHHYEAADGAHDLAGLQIFYRPAFPDRLHVEVYPSESTSEYAGWVAEPGDETIVELGCCSAQEDCRTCGCGLYCVVETAHCEHSDSNLASGALTQLSEIVISLEAVPPYQIVPLPCASTQTNNPSNQDYLYRRNLRRSRNCYRERPVGWTDPTAADERRHLCYSLQCAIDFCEDQEEDLARDRRQCTTGRDRLFEMG